MLRFLLPREIDFVILAARRLSIHLHRIPSPNHPVRTIGNARCIGIRFACVSCHLPLYERARKNWPNLKKSAGSPNV